jgi:aarF domain-containing kinase
VSDTLTADLSFLYVAARVLEFLNPSLKRTSLSGIVGDIRESMMEEVDFLKEARNISQFEVLRNV